MTPGGPKILVTGAGGFIGSHLVDALLAAGHRVRAYLRYTSSAGRGWLDRPELDAEPRLELAFGDIRDPATVSAAVEGCDVVMHLASLIGIPYSYLTPREYIEVNVLGTLNVLEACRRHQIRRIVHTSTSETYGTAQYVPIDERHPLVGQSPYSASKIAADKLVESFHLSFGTPVVTLRPFNTFGPRQSQRAVIPTIVTQLLEHPDFLDLGAVDTQRDYTFVSDTAAAFVAAMEAPGVEGDVLNLGTGSALAIREIVDLASRRLGARPEVRSVGERMRPAASEVLRLVSDNRRARARLGWAPQVGFEEGLDRVIAFFRTSRPRRGGAFAL